MTIPVAEPNISALEHQYVAEAISSGWVSGSGAFVDRFEDMLCKHTGAAWAVAVQSGTAALHVAIQATLADCAASGTAQIRSLNFIAGANALRACGITPKFVDIVGEWSPDISGIGDPSRGFGVIDAAPGIGRAKAQHGVYTCLSFNGNKMVTTGQGGAVIGMSAWMERPIRHLVDVCKVHGDPDHYTHDGAGFNYRMSNINAAFGCAQMERLPEFLERKRAIMARYREAGLTMVDSDWLAIWKAGNRSGAISDLSAVGISAKPFWKPLHLQAPYEHCPREAMTRTEALWKRLVCLPCSSNLTDDDMEKVLNACAALR